MSEVSTISMPSTVAFLFPYLFSLLLFFNSNSLVILWICFELNILFFLLLVLYLEKMSISRTLRMMLYYFLIQSLGSFFLLFLASRWFPFSDFIQRVLFVAPIWLKIGFFPLHLWVFKMRTSLRPLCFFLLATLQKLPPFFLLFGFGGLFSVILWLLNFIVGPFMIYLSSCRKELLLRSSFYSAFWFFLSYTLNPLYFFLVYGYYCLSIFFIWGFNSLYAVFSSLKGFNIYIFSVLGISGVPPFRMFFIKAHIIFHLGHILRPLLLRVLLLFSIWAILGYFKLFCKNIEYSSKLNFFSSKRRLGGYYALFFFSCLLFIL